MSREKEQANNDILLKTDANAENPHEDVNPKLRKKFVEPSVSSPTKVLEATRFLFQASVGGGEDLLS
jgi:hypothetical protein